MKTRRLDGFDISDDAIYAFGHFTAVVTFKGGGIDEIYVGATAGDFSDAALHKVLTTGQPLCHLQGWLSYIEPDVQSTATKQKRHALHNLVKTGAQTFSGVDGSGKAWLIGFDGQNFAFSERDSVDAPLHRVKSEDLCIVSNICVISTEIEADQFVVNTPSDEMIQWLQTQLASVALAGTQSKIDPCNDV
jgi:hypothetical protein